MGATHSAKSVVAAYGDADRLTAPHRKSNRTLPYIAPASAHIQSSYESQ